MRLLKLVTAPTGNVISLEDAKAQARVDGNEEDQLILAYIQDATAKAEFLTHTKLLTQVWDWYLDEFPVCAFRVPMAPLVSLDSIKYYDVNNVLQTFSSASYQVDVAGLRPRILLAPNASWPTVYDRINAIQIRMTVGYGAAAAVPQAIKHWIMAAVAEGFKNRELSIERNQEIMSRFMNGLLDPYTVPVCE